MDRVELADMLASQLSDQSAILAEIRAILRDINAKLTPSAPTPEQRLLQAVLGCTGSVFRFSAADLIERDDPLLRELLDGSALEVGRLLASLEGTEVCGRRLVRRGRASDGAQWGFEVT